jgi:LPPG:FO 2-phospho-L-lactate transferase
MSMFGSVVCLSGGVGGARLLHGLAQVLEPDALTAIVNTGDDFRHWGLAISPDLDTVMYTLGGLADEQRGWGLSNESFRTFERMTALGAPGWFMLGDRDLATHLVRSEALSRGEPLTRITERLCKAAGVRHRVLPMCDEPRRTLVTTFEHGTLPFQEWLVERRAPRVTAVRFEGAREPSRAVLRALEHADLVVIGPSNPYVSIDPILTLAGVRERIADKLVVALSPIVGGRAVKGPLAEMIRALDGADPSPAAIVSHYQGLLSAIVVEQGDEGFVDDDTAVCAARTVMGGAADRARLAREILAFAETLL